MSKATPTRRRPVVLALEAFLNDHPGEALKHLQSYDDKTQEFYLRSLPILARMSTKKANTLNERELAVLANELERLLQLLRAHGELAIDQMAFCSRIDGYGMYQLLNEAHVFRPGTRGTPGERVQIYVQLSNLLTIKHGHCYETRIAGSVHVTDKSGKEWWYLNLENGNRSVRCQALRRDVFRNYSFHVPHLPPGEYNLTVVIRDLTRPGVERSARHTLPFRVGI